MPVTTRKDVFLTALEMKVHKAPNSMGSVSTNLHQRAQGMRAVCSQPPGLVLPLCRKWPPAFSINSRWVRSAGTDPPGAAPKRSPGCTDSAHTLLTPSLQICFKVLTRVFKALNRQGPNEPWRLLLIAQPKAAAVIALGEQG